MSDSASVAGEREFHPRATGKLFPWVKRVSWLELGVFAGLLVVWLAPGLERATFWFGLAHGVGFLILCAMIWVAVLRREAPFWLLASALTPVGPVGSTLGITYIERREARSTPAASEATGDPYEVTGEPPRSTGEASKKTGEPPEVTRA